VSRCSHNRSHLLLSERRGALVLAPWSIRCKKSLNDHSPIAGSLLSGMAFSARREDAEETLPAGWLSGCSKRCSAGRSLWWLLGTSVQKKATVRRERRRVLLSDMVDNSGSLCKSCWAGFSSVRSPDRPSHSAVRPLPTSSAGCAGYLGHPFENVTLKTKVGKAKSVLF